MSKSLLESIEDDIEESGLSVEEIEALGISTTPTDDGDDYDSDEVRERIENRKQKRSDGDGTGDGRTPPNDGGTSRGTGGNASDDGKTSSQDGKTTPVSEDDEPAPTSPAGWAKTRRELREAKAVAARATELEAEIAKLKATPVTTTAPATTTTNTIAAGNDARPKTIAELGKEPDRNEDLAGWLVWNAESARIREEQRDNDSRNHTMAQQVSSAIFAEHQAYQATNPNYDAALDHAKKEFFSAARKFTDMNDAQIKLKLNELIVKTAIEAKKKGVGLGETLYDMAIERYGYIPPDENADTITTTKTAPTTKKIDLKVVASNKRRSASSMEGGGQRSTPKFTLEQKANMTMAELMALPVDEWESI